MANVGNLEGIRLGVVRGISYGLFGPPDPFVSEARALGAGLVRAYVYWQQVEPEPGRYRWDAVDSLLRQLSGQEEVWLTVCSSSRWATQRATDFLPPSPACDLYAYEGFVRQLVQHCRGRVNYWQCDNEPSNTHLLWAGTATEYVTQLSVMYRAVKAADPSALVVLGGCGYDVWSSPEGSPARQFFEELVRDGQHSFDLFSVNLYGVPKDIPCYIETAQQLMRRHGCDKPIIVGEYGGPVLFEFPEVEQIAQAELVSAFAHAPKTQGTEELIANAGRDTPERRAMLALYRRLPELPARMQMFMAGCPARLEALRHRINCRQIVMRNLLALAAGVRRTAYWNLAPEVPAAVDPYQIMHLMFGKMTLLDYQNRRLSRRYPGADTFAFLARQLTAAQSVSRVALPDHPSVYLFRIERAQRGPLWVAWDDRDPFSGENEPAIELGLPWTARRVKVTDTFQRPQPARIAAGTPRIALSATPLFIEHA